MFTSYGCHWCVPERRFIEAYFVSVRLELGNLQGFLQFHGGLQCLLPYQHQTGLSMPRDLETDCCCEGLLRGVWERLRSLCIIRWRVRVWQSSVTSFNVAWGFSLVELTSALEVPMSFRVGLADAASLSTVFFYTRQALPAPVGEA